MKNLFLFIGITTIALFVSCSNSDQNNQSTATSIVLTVSSSTVQVNQNVQLTVTNNLTQDVTASSTFYVNNAIITGTVFTPTQAGTYTLYATSGSLVSNEVVITVNDEVVANNSVVVDNVAYTTDQSTLFYLGSYFSDTELDSDGLSYWIAKTYNTTGTIENPEYPNGSWIYFTTLQQSPAIIEFPTVRAYILGNEDTANTIFDLDFKVNSEAVLAEEIGIKSATMNIIAFEQSDTVQNYTFNYTTTLDDDAIIYGQYSGAWEYADATGGRSINNSGKSRKVVKLNQAQIKANLFRIIQ